MNNLDIKVELHKFRPFDFLRRGRLQIVCSGKDCNDQFINTIGRIAVKRIPIYAYAKSLIKIERINPETGYHDSVPFNHDMIRDRLKNTPIFGLDPGISFLHEKFWKDVDYLSPDREIHEKEKRVEVYIDSKNTANEEEKEAIMHVTTNDIKIYVDNELTKLYDEKYPHLIISLKPKEGIKCSMKAVFGVGLNDTCWDACSNFWYDQETIPDKTIVSFESSYSPNEFVLVERSLEYFRLRTKMLKDEIHRLYLLEKNPTNKFQIKIVDEDHTMGEPIAYELQSHPKILKASNSKPDHLVREIVIEVVSYKKEELLDAILESMDNLLTKIDKFELEFKKIIPNKSNNNDQTEKSNGKSQNKIKKTKKN
jgi:DNA-directed RNA polymerase subunit L